MTSTNRTPRASMRRRLARLGLLVASVVAVVLWTSATAGAHADPGAEVAPVDAEGSGQAIDPTLAVLAAVPVETAPAARATPPGAARAASRHAARAATPRAAREAATTRATPPASPPAAAPASAAPSASTRASVSAAAPIGAADAASATPPASHPQPAKATTPAATKATTPPAGPPASRATPAPRVTTEPDAGAADPVADPVRATGRGAERRATPAPPAQRATEVLTPSDLGAPPVGGGSPVAPDRPHADAPAERGRGQRPVTVPSIDPIVSPIDPILAPAAVDTAAPTAPAAAVPGGTPSGGAASSDGGRPAHPAPGQPAGRPSTPVVDDAGTVTPLPGGVQPRPGVGGFAGWLLSHGQKFAAPSAVSVRPTTPVAIEPGTGSSVGVSSRDTVGSDPVVRPEGSGPGSIPAAVLIELPPMRGLVRPTEGSTAIAVATPAQVPTVSAVGPTRRATTGWTADMTSDRPVAAEMTSTSTSTSRAVAASAVPASTVTDGHDGRRTPSPDKGTGGMHGRPSKPAAPAMPERGSSASGGLSSLLGGGSGAGGTTIPLHSLQVLTATALALSLARFLAMTHTANWKSLVVTTCAERPG